MTPTPEQWESAVGVAVVLIFVSGAVAALRRLGFLGGGRPAPASGQDSRVSDLDGRLDRHEARIAGVERAVSGLASREDIHGLQIELEKQAGTMREIRAVMDKDTKTVARLDGAITRIEDHLLGGAK